MSREQNHEAAPSVVMRDHQGNQLNSLDTNHDGRVGMAEINPARPENGHDLLIAGTAGLAITAAFIVAASIEGAKRARRFFSVSDADPGADSGPSV